MLEQIKKLLQDARIGEALELLVTLEPDATILLATFNDASKRHRLGLIDYKEFSQKQSQVTFAALEYLQAFGNKNSTKTSHSANANSKEVRPKKMFISYSKSDKAYLEEFKKQLSPYRRQNLVEIWDDSKIGPGEEWDNVIKRELAVANIIVLLISADLIATDYIWDVEMKEAMERHERKEATVVPVIIRPCAWENAPFGKLNALPEKGVPVEKWTNKDEAWTQVVKRISALL